MSEEIAKKPRITKKGLPDKRAESSKKNLEKGKSIIKEALKIAKEKQINKPKLEVVYSSDEYTTDEEEIVLTTKQLSKEKSEKDLTIKQPELQRRETEVIKPDDEGTKSGAEHYTFTFEKKLEEKIKALNDDYTQKLSVIENDTKLTKAELNALKLQNQALKKTMTNNFRTHAGIINEEMYLKF